MKTASIKYLVKFTSIDFAMDILKKNYVFLSSPLNFNDPLDSYFVTLVGRRPSIETRWALKEYLDISEETYVFCGTFEKNIENVLMWSHYGNGHKGIALKYKIPDSYSGKLDRVSYDVNSHEEFANAIGNGNPFKVPKKDESERNKLVEDSIFIKDKEWSYEKEIRYTKKFKNNEDTIEYGWNVESVYIGSEYLNNDNKHLKELLSIIDFCLKQEIEVFLMDYLFDKEQKKYRLRKRPMLEKERKYEDYSLIRKNIISELKTRFKESIDGEVLIELVKEISRKEAEECNKRQLEEASRLVLLR